MPYVVTATWTAQPGQEDVVLDAITKLGPLSRAEEGNQYYQAFQDPAEPSIFRLFEVYDDEAAAQAHWASEHFATYGAGQAIPALATRERAFYETIG
ncbi:putative quinol monooxygenase [Nocardioides sp.]|jgi:quinol monooxygenase YgiN|uniref:putative quinol monooxygenase n=1 Tax=Nocardioides sp. TaxID=35761 RepID=UPI002635F930|nr:putative quinol monooxygenase [Nocardioides sp.]